MKNDPIKLSQNGKIEITSKVKVTAENLAQIYTPGVAQVVTQVMTKSDKVYDLTWKKNVIAIVSDGSAILGLGNQGAEAALPVMEAKAVLFKELGGVNAVPLVLNTQDPQEIISIIKALEPSFGGINIEDIAAPNCFIIKEALKKQLKIPVFHDDQYGTAIVVLAGLINAAKVVKKDLKRLKIIISGAGAAGIATAKMLGKYGCQNIILFDSQGALWEDRPDMNFYKKRIAHKTNPGRFKGDLKEALGGADVFIGLSKGNLLSQFDIEKMNSNAIVFGLANPVPEIMPEEAHQGGAAVVATGRSDFPNQINNALVFPGIFRGALETRTVQITDAIKLQAAKALAATVPNPTAKKIIPEVMDMQAVEAISGVFGG